MIKSGHLQGLIDRAAKAGAVPAAVAYPCSVPALEAALVAAKAGVIKPILVGPEKKIRALAEKNKLVLGKAAFHDTPDDPVLAAVAAVDMCRSGQAEILIKGSLHTDELLGVVVRKEGGLRTSRCISHAFVFEVPTYPKLLMMADCVVNISPGLMEKRDIIQNAVDLALRLKIKRPKVTVLAAVETVNPAMVATMEAACLSKMAERGQIVNADVDGPLAFDVAISREAAATKGLKSISDPDILIVPNIEAGNMLYKQLVYLAGAGCAGMILGAKVPIVLTSRADSVMTRVASCALASLSR